MELSPGEDCADVHEATEVEKDVKTAVDFIVSLVRFFQVHAIPVEGVSGDEAREQIIGTERTTDTDGEELECCVSNAGSKGSRQDRNLHRWQLARAGRSPSRSTSASVRTLWRTCCRNR